MDSRVSLVVAGLLILCAGGIGYWGLSMSQPSPAADEPALNATPTTAQLTLPTERLVVAVRDIPAFSTLSAEDLRVEQVQKAPVGSFSDPAAVIGKQLYLPINNGNWLHSDAFFPGSTLAHMIQPQERAIAINVDDIVTAGGHLRPGDYVDVLLYRQQTDPTSSNREESSQVILQGLRILSFGPNIGPLPEHLPRPSDEEKQARAASQGRSVVLAVPEPLSNRLLLASQAGTLRLALRSAHEKLAERPAEQALATASEWSAPLPLSSFNAYASQAPKRPASPRPQAMAAPRQLSVEIIRGTQSSQQTP